MLVSLKRTTAQLKVRGSLGAIILTFHYPLPMPRHAGGSKAPLPVLKPSSFQKSGHFHCDRYVRIQARKKVALERTMAKSHQQSGHLELSFPCLGKKEKKTRALSGLVLRSAPPIRRYHYPAERSPSQGGMCRLRSTPHKLKTDPSR